MSGPAPVDGEMIRTAVTRLIEPGAVVEVRALIGRKRVVSGYFRNDPEGVGALVQGVIAWSRQPLAKNRPDGFYMTHNRIDPQLLGRYCNRFEDYAALTTADNHVTRRRWLLVDTDPVRPAGVSATEAQHAEALRVAGQVADFLQGLGVETIRADSGNGGHLLVPLDLENSEESRALLEAVLTAFDHRFSTERVKVDRTTFNAARIGKLYGTVAGKGDSTADQPHRQARLLSLPENPRPATREQLQAIAALQPEEPARRTAVERSGGVFDIDRFLAQHCPDAVAQPYKDGRKWQIQCPFDPSHAQPDAVVFQRGNGALGFKCSHNSCRGRDWAEFRRHFDPEGARAALRPAADATAVPAAAPPDREERHPFFRFFREQCGWDSGTFSPFSAFSSESLEAHVPPPMRAAAFHGIAGEFVRLWEPETEACAEALLVQFLAAAGSIFGPGPFIRRGADFHRLKLNVILVGPSSDGGKGTSLSPVVQTLRLVDEAWYRARFNTAVSGEGIVRAVRDETRELQAAKKSGVPTGEMIEVVVDAGAAEKRLFVTGTEFSSVLKAGQRQGSTLSDVIRMAWDDDFLQVPTKHFPYRATGCHVTVCGHITPVDLARYLSIEDRKNGFANRFLWCASRRARSLPSGGKFPDITGIVQRLTRCLSVPGPEPVEITVSPAGEQQWDQGGIYEALRACARSTVGELLSRAAPYVLRLASVYALLDRSTVIAPAHLAAALAVWEYCERSVHQVFEKGLGNRMAEFILLGLRACPPEKGPTRSDIGKVFGDGHARETDRVDEALQLLSREGLAKPTRTPTRGRPVTQWNATGRLAGPVIDWGWAIESLQVEEKAEKALLVAETVSLELLEKGNKSLALSTAPGRRIIEGEL